MAGDAEVAAMRRALVLAQTPDVTPGPNPLVGAVVLDARGETLAEAYHRGAGTPHAEAEAVRQAAEHAAGATVVVSLEPCHHTGRTGPCTQALVDAGVRRVVFAQADLNPEAGGGAEALRAAGVDVEGGVLADESAALNEVWTFAIRQRRPFVTWKFAATLDGRSAASDGSSRWITGPQARADVHRQRAVCDTVLVGTGTALADNPRLNVRGGDGHPLPRDRQPLRAVMGMRTIPPSSAVLDESAHTVVLRTQDPHAALDELFAQERRHVWLEGGPTLAAAFLRAGLVDEVVAYVAPTLLGAGPNAVADLGVTTVEEQLRLELVSVQRLDDDLRLTLRRHTHEEQHQLRGRH